jgi:DNA mismatch repair protein MutL
MSIEILPAQLANQIAAGEVVERPASVIKELVENSLDAGATTVKIQIEKGGAKRIKITDNGSGIPKSELTLALSRHATSKIKNLNDLEGICSLGFRGEALASISSVSRLTLTSKPKDQELAWQAIAEGRDMNVEVTPAAHPDGTSIDVQDLFFNTPARRKFLRTDKTEFTHIEEVVKRIALARLDVTIILIHNDKIIRQYRAANTKQQYSKRVAQICGQKFIEHAIEVECEHNDLHFSGWLAKPSFVRNQNDICYSYVNGRMMKDKLINHAIRQAYENLLPPDTYPAFVLFLTLNFRDVDVNVHPAKHEVRFHQGRYIHDFIFSVCKKALHEEQDYVVELPATQPHEQRSEQYQHETGNRGNTIRSNQTANSLNNVHYSDVVNKNYQDQEYIKPLTQVNENASSNYSGAAYSSKPNSITSAQSNAYHQLLSNEYEHTNQADEKHAGLPQSSDSLDNIRVLHVVSSVYALVLVNDELRIAALSTLHSINNAHDLKSKFEQGLVSQPLLLPIKMELDAESVSFVENNDMYLDKLGVVVNVLNKSHIQIRQFPAVLRHKDVVGSFSQLIDQLMIANQKETLMSEHWLNCFSLLLQQDKYSIEEALSIMNKGKKNQGEAFESTLLLNSVPVDLTSELSQLMHNNL